MTEYQKRKERAREEAKRWQREFNDTCYDWYIVSFYTAHFEKIGKRYGLIKEFKENGIL